jgi:hypothetical protein
MSASLEAYLARLYLDADARRTFADPRGATAHAGLDTTDAAGVQRVGGVDPIARSSRGKRDAHPRRRWLRRRLDRWRHHA